MFAIYNGIYDLVVRNIDYLSQFCYTGKMENVEILRRLERAGFTEKEAQVYLALVLIGGGTAYQIAQKCEVKKPTAYVVLEELRKKGLVLKVPHAKKALFTPRDITEYLDDQEDRIMAARSVVSELKTLESHQRPNVFFFNGLRGIKEAIEYKFDIMRGKKFYGFYSNLADASDSLLRLYQAWDRDAVANDISFDIIMAKKGSGRYYKDIINLSKANKNVRIRFLNDYDYPQNQTIDMCDDFVRIVDEKKLHATIIDDKNTAAAFYQIFKVAWGKDV